MTIECTTLSVSEHGEGFDINEILPIAIAGILIGAIVINTFTTAPS